MDLILKEGIRRRPDVSALASMDKNSLSVLAWHYHDEDLPGPVASVQIELNGLPPRAGEIGIRHFRIDDQWSNAYSVWKGMGSPPLPTAEQYARLEKAGQLARVDEPMEITDEGSTVTVHLDLPRQAVSLLVLEWRPAGN